jgi:hypothetical protein
MVAAEQQQLEVESMQQLPMDRQRLLPPALLRGDPGQAPTAQYLP